MEGRSVELQDLARTLEAQRRASDAERARLATILASMGDAVLVVDRAGRPVLTNAACERMFGDLAAGFTPEDERGQALAPEDTPQRRAVRGEPFSMPFTLTAADGTRRWFEAHGQPIQGGGQECAVIIIRDITERSLRRLQDEFLALASHELRTPLTPLHGYLEMLISVLEPSADERTRRYAAQALVQTRRLRMLVNDLLDVARLQTGKLSLNAEPLNLVPLVAQAVEAARFLAAGQAIQLDATPDPILVRGDAGRLEQVLLNLLTNAIHYAPGTDRIAVRLRRTGGEAEIQVHDDGPGIAAEDLPNLFTRFYQVAHAPEGTKSGLGLGLYIAKELVTAHQGRIDVRSVPGEGTTFTVRLPVVSADERDASG
jgi:two-component system CheB/CheR fusion protein